MSGESSDGTPSQPLDEVPEAQDERASWAADAEVEDPEPIELADVGAGHTSVEHQDAPSDEALVEAAGISDAPAPELYGTHPAGVAGGELHDAGIHASVVDHEPAELEDAAEAAAAAGPKRPVKGASRLGLLAMVLGMAACVLCRQLMFPPSLRISPVPLALAGLVLAFLAGVGILFGSRARSGLPLLAILLCLAAIGIAAYQGGARDVVSTRHWADGQIGKYRSVLHRFKDKIVPPQNPAGGVARQPGSSNPQPGSPAGVSQADTGANPGGVGATGRPVSPDSGIGAGTIFDMRPGSPGSSAGAPGGPALPSPTPGGTGASPAPARVVPGTSAPGSVPGGLHAPGVDMTSRIRAAHAGLQAAEGKVKAVEEDFRNAYARKNDPQYLAAKADVAAADKGVDDAKLRSDGFGQPLIDATRRRKEAQEKVARIVNDAMARDPVVAASRRDLEAAEESLRHAYDPAGRSR